MKNEIRWVSIERDNLESSLYGNSTNFKYGSALNFGRPRPNLNRLALGYVVEERKSNYSPPSLIVVEANSVPDMFSWIWTFSPATAPLSHFARVVTDEDWNTLAESRTEKRYFAPQREDRWACLVLGEALAQADGETEISSIPISVASSCFSTTVARAAVLYGTDEAMTTCMNRLTRLQSDRRFQSRPISVEELIPAWNTLALIADNELEPGEAVSLVMDAVSTFGTKSTRNTSNIRLPSLMDHTGLYSDSVEERVVTYQKLVNALIHSPTSLAQDSRANALVAAAAFLVGRGTSHSFLIRRAAKVFSSSFVWYGLIAALAGPSSWDAQWSRMTKGIERLVRAKFEWTDSSTADLCWVEYSWLAKVYESAEVFHSIPKMFSRGLTIEVLPGASCQLRFSENNQSTSDIRHSTSNIVNTQKLQSSARERELESSLAQFLNLAAKTRSLLETSSTATAASSTVKKSTSQRHLELEENKEPQKILRATRRPKRSE